MDFNWWNGGGGNSSYNNSNGDTCDRPGCSNPVYAEGLCQHHYETMYTETCSRCGKRVIILCEDNLCEDCHYQDERNNLLSQGICPACGGIGMVSRIDSPMVTCPTCGGSGKA